MAMKRRKRIKWEERDFTPEEVQSLNELLADLQNHNEERAAAPPVIRVALTKEVLSVAGEVVTEGYRHLSKARHPDVGGTHDAMQKLNNANQWLKQLLTKESN
jgi:hypothetical protein